MRFRKFLKPYKTRGSSFREHTGYGKRWHYNAEQVIELRAFPNIKMTLGEIFESVF